ncbi:MAG TPA: AI-2E family transporter [Rubrobacteraceae bacterium]|nr:AI-2E family transporter [Rubrobacteraceae bacterium]
MTRRGRGVESRRPPTPIPVSSRTITVIAVVCLLVLLLVLYAAPIILIIAFGGTALAIVLSYPVRALSRVMPRGLAILVTFLALIGLVVLALVYLIPILIEQLSRLIAFTPEVASTADRLLNDTLRWLDQRELLGGAQPDEFVGSILQDVFTRLRELSENVLGSLVGLISGAFNFGVMLFGILFVAVYLLVDVRKVKAAYLRAAPHSYRRDAQELWDAFGLSLSRYLGGLVFVILIQGTLAGLALHLLGIQYALLLGVWVSLTAIIPYLGAFLGAIPAVILAAFTDNPVTTVTLTIIVYVAIQQLEGNVLTPRIQGYALHVHPILVLFAVIAGGQLAGLTGIVFAVPTLAVLRVFFDFFRVRLQTKSSLDPDHAGQ